MTYDFCHEGSPRECGQKKGIFYTGFSCATSIFSRQILDIDN
jgi:hypothetical protein